MIVERKAFVSRPGSRESMMGAFFAAMVDWVVWGKVREGAIDLAHAAPQGMSLIFTPAKSVLFFKEAAFVTYLLENQEISEMKLFKKPVFFLDETKLLCPKSTCVFLIFFPRQPFPGSTFLCLFIEEGLSSLQEERR